MGEVASDFISLAELQTELFKADARDAVKELTVPIALLVVAVAVGVGTIPIALLFVAEAMAAIGLPLWAGVLIAAMIGLGSAAMAGVVGVKLLRKPLEPFRRSRDELKSNLQWIKRVLSRRTTP
jgi:hypothetical protein